MKKEIQFKKLTGSQIEEGYSYLFLYKGAPSSFYIRTAILEDGTEVKFHTRLSQNPNNAQWYKINYKDVDFVGIGKLPSSSGKSEKRPNEAKVVYDVREKIVSSQSTLSTIVCINCGSIIFDDQTDLCPTCLSIAQWQPVHSSNVTKLLPVHEKENFWKNAMKIDEVKLLDDIKLEIDG